MSSNCFLSLYFMVLYMRIAKECKGVYLVSKKEIYASIEITDHEIRLVVGEFYDTRFNILRVERTGVTGVDHKEIVDEQKVVNSIIKAVKQAEEALGYKIERVLLAIPSIRMHRYNRRVQVIPIEGSRRIRLSDIQKGLNDAIGYKPEDDLELVNVGCIKYITNGITSRKMPLEETCDLMIMSVDLLYADKETVYSFARCVERAGLEILDICLDSYAIAQEAAVFEQTVDKYVVLVDVSRHNTTLSLFTHGKLVNCEILDHGYDLWMEKLCKETQLSKQIGYRLLQNTCHFKEDEALDSVIYIWSHEGEQHQITEKEVCRYVAPYVENWIQQINEVCTPIVENGDVRYLLTGEGCEIQSIEQVLNRLNAPWTIYVPQIFGARDCALVTCLGIFYSWVEQLTIRSDGRVSCEILSEDTIGMRKQPTSEEGGFTKRLRKMLLNSENKS